MAEKMRVQKAIMALQVLLVDEPMILKQHRIADNVVDAINALKALIEVKNALDEGFKEPAEYIPNYQVYGDLLGIIEKYMEEENDE